MNTHWKGPIIALIDMLLSLMIVFAAQSLLAPKAQPIVTAFGDKPICMMAIDIEWDGKVTSDVDLWVKDPIDEKSIGYANAHGKLSDLVRDDLGGLVDLTGNHSERNCLRGLVDGEYTVGIDLFRHDAEDGFPIPIKLVVSSIDPGSATMHEIYSSVVVLEATREEVTGVDFMIKNGVVIQESINVIPNPIKGYQ